MGRNKPRSKAVDVTKSLLQQTSIRDHIAVQIAGSNILQVTEDDLSPTQGSEAAFALRREGKLDTSIKLCLNWRQGNCHNHAACTFAHVIPFFGVNSEGSGSPGTPGKPAGLSADSGGGHPYSSGAVGREAGGRGGDGAPNASWPPKVATSFYTAPASGQRVEDGASGPLAASAQLPAVTTGAVSLECADATGATEAAPSSNVSAPSTAVVSADGLRSILASLTATLASKEAVSSVGDAGEQADATEAGGFCVKPCRQWLREVAESAEAEEKAAFTDQHYSWRQPQATSMEDFVDAAGQSLLGEPLWQDGSAADLYYSLAERAAAANAIAMHRRQEAAPYLRQLEMVGLAGSPNPCAFSTAPTPTEPSGIAAMIAQPTLVDLLMEEARSAGREGCDVPVLPLSGARTGAI
ncbi:hypothetical protein LSCM1_04329 [Leishmania martiniquensis]|uniref:C3H1-type domain-containing protein n=1 Tax=Leishmania martiniquensis TaxID=1580590 RepID=A0A836GTK2_9TRYP|nr:hypothetical protein LSCM1_04329 [Leishmania martiniquensis]